MQFDLFIVSVIIRQYLSCIRSELAKLYTAIHERFGHVSRSSLKRVVSPDSALFLMSVYKTSRLRLNSFLFPRLRGRFFLQVAASLVMLFFVENCHKKTQLHGDRLHCQLSGFNPNLIFVLAFQIALILGTWQCMASS